jgi:DNA adenine methylase
MMATPAVTRPVLRYHGGKWRLAPWIISHFPEHRVYVEPFGGGGSVLMRKRRAYAEIYNDLDSEVVNVFRILRDPSLAQELERLIRLTPFARDSFEAAYTPADDPVEQARRTVFKAFAGHGSDSIHRGKASDLGMFTRVSQWRAATGFRSDSNRSGTTPAHDWNHYPDQLSAFCERLGGVVIENRPAAKVIEQYDYPDALIYADPPYVRSSRGHRDHGYKHEMTDDDHRELAEQLRSVRGMVVLSAYHSDLYDELYRDWRRYKRHVRTYNNKGKGATEVLWISPNVPAGQHELFGEG